MKKCGWLALSLVMAAVGVVGCGSDDDESSTPAESSCFYECGGMTSCMSGPMAQADCTSQAESDCGGAPDQLEFQAGCSCPGWDDPNECATPPSWYQ